MRRALGSIAVKVEWEKAGREKAKQLLGEQGQSQPKQAVDDDLLRKPGTFDNNKNWILTNGKKLSCIGECSQAPNLQGVSLINSRLLIYPASPWGSMESHLHAWTAPFPCTSSSGPAMVGKRTCEFITAESAQSQSPPEASIHAQTQMGTAPMCSFRQESSYHP